MSLTTCLKKMGAAISPKDKAAILSLARGYRSQGLDPTAAAIQAVSDQAEIAQSRLAELSTADRQVESTPLPSKRVADTPQAEADALTNAARSFFGTTKDTREAGYILPDGDMLDFSGRHYSDNHPSLRGQRSVDHRELTGENSKGESIEDLFRINSSGGSGSDYMQEFMTRTGAMRVDFHSNVASIMGEPTAEQIKVLANGIRGDYAALSVIDPESGRIISDGEIDNPTPMKVRRFFDQARGKKADPTAPLFSKRADTPQTETENFKRWFGDSKVVDAQGKPLVVYHGTERDFDAFKVGSALGWGRGIYFTDNQEYTREFGDRTVAAYVKIENPWRGGIPDGIESTNAWRAIADRWDYFEDAWQEDSGFVGDVLRELGYDGVIAKDSNDVDGLEVVAFRPTQIKSAIGNNGDFDPSKPSILASKRTRQDAEKDAEPTPRFNSATEFWTNNIGKPLFNMISRATKSVVANDFLKRHGLNLAEDMPPEAQKAWRAYKQDVGNLKKTVSEIADEAKKLTPEERAMVSDLVEREMKAGVTPPEAVIRMATLMTSIMRKQSQQLVETGMLSKDAADRWEGRYLPRFYQKHLLTNPFDAMLRKAYLSGIKGTHLKGRGLFETVPVEDVPAYEKMGWEVRDPEHGKKPSLKGLPEGSKVRVWRDFTPAERQKMGEVRDAMYRFARGYTDTQIDIAKGKLFDHIARTVARDDNPGGSYVLVPDTSVPGTGVKKFGNLAGKYVPGDVLSALKTKAGPDSDITRAYLKALSLWKEGKTSLNPVTHVNNMVSNLVMSDLAGVNLVDPRSWKLYADTFNDYRKEGAWFKEAQKAGLFGGEWYGNEVAQWLPLPSELKDSGQRSIPGKFAMKTANALGSVRRGMGNLYRAEDQFFKLLLYKQARERGLEPNDAVTWAEKFVFDYSTAAPGVTKLKNTLFPFANYSSKAVPALTFAATHYPWRIAKWIGLLSGFSLYAFNTLYGDDEAEEMAESEAAMMPDYLKGRSSFFGVPKAIRLPYDDESTGDGMYVDISRFVPLGDLFDAENQSGGVPLPAPLTPNNPIITTAIAMLANKLHHWVR